MIALLVVTDGREDYLTAAVQSARDAVRDITERVMYDDTGDDDYRTDLAERFPDFTHINGGGRQGFGGAIRTAWAWLAEHSTADFVFHLEQDFTFNRPVPVVDMAAVLAADPEIVQVALRRQPWNDHERLAGGIVEQHPDAYTDATVAGFDVLLHRLFFTTNPSLYRRSLCSTEWPEGSDSEGHFTHRILQSDPAARFAFWGDRASGEAVHHIGHQRAGIGY